MSSQTLPPPLASAVNAVTSLPVWVSVPAGVWLIYRLALWLVTPKPLPGIPHYPVRPFGDLGRVLAHVRETGFRSTWFGIVARDLGPIGQVQMGPSTKIIVLSDIQETEDILLRRTKEFDRSDDMISRFDQFIPHGQIALKTDTEFKNHRRFLTPAMTQKYLSAMTPGMSWNARELYRFWDKKRNYLRGEAFDPTVDFEISITDTLSELTFGQSFGLVSQQRKWAEQKVSELKAQGIEPTPENIVGPTSDIHEANNLLLKYAGKTINSLFPRYYHFFVRRRADYRKAKTTVWKFLAEKITEARIKAETSDVENANCVVDLIAGLERQESNANIKMPLAEFQDELWTYMIGGTETTAVALRWVVKLLAAHPEKQRKLHDELVNAGIPSALDEDAPLTTFADVNSDKTPYLDAVANEILRFSRLANLTTRETLTDTVILGHHIPKGTTILFTITGTSFSETSKDRAAQDALANVRSKSSVRRFGYWGDDAEQFVPERWIDADGKFDAKAGPNLAFSTGPRGCYGQKLAMLDLKLYLAILSATFFLDKVPGHLDKWDITEGLTLSPKYSHVVVKRWDEV
ncbi:cytochrome P450 [Punctularia strigosozonata HHB-11173 SS5]|uniref:cytochrome P450 n=1 Tax=Punctularia strigosozonata (strain HHB-11173) TaxID=741275 RepID=UPI0004416BC4|nr:cytochrome P450 [Punctularia strigosozonata HHB-11173 SS5]EIN09897.1 cytochrome P450 [Punctularia strigosozonata HHB-11173 SS5]